MKLKDGKRRGEVLIELLRESFFATELARIRDILRRVGVAEGDRWDLAIECWRRDIYTLGVDAARVKLAVREAQSDEQLRRELAQVRS